MNKEMITVVPPMDAESIVIRLESGHSALVERNDNKGSSISARFQQKAAMMGCIIQNMTQLNQEQKPHKDKVQTSIIEAIGQLTPEDYNSAGFPNLEAVSKAAGFKVTSAQLTKAWTAFQDEAEG